MSIVLHNGRFFQSEASGSQDAHFADCLVVDEASGKIQHVGSAQDGAVLEARAAGARLHDMAGRVVVPGFIDSHMHLLQTGELLSRPNLDSCKTLDEIRQIIRDYAQANPDLARIICRGWMQPSTDGLAKAGDLDDLDPRPIHISAEDMHSAWCNTAAIEELGVADLPDPPGGVIHRDESGRPTGLLSESAALGIVWPFLTRASSVDERVQRMHDAFDAYISAGYTGLVELATDDTAWDTLLAFRSRRPEGTLPIPLAIHWLILPQASEEETMKQVDRAIELHGRFNAVDTPDCRITGIKIVCDGVVDSCTAALRDPYAHSGHVEEPVWSLEQLAPVLKKADGAGLQCALHAIGDAAIKLALDSLEQVGNPTGRHRIEHLETCTPEDAQRLGPLGIIASIQPVHGDPAILDEWPRLLGPQRCKHIFPYAALAKAGAVLALGTDSPTASLKPLPNLYVATTRRSAREPERAEQTTPQFALSLVTALAAATRGAAYSCFADRCTGTLEVGKAANLAVICMEWDAQKLLEARVAETWLGGQRIYVADTES
ncbi:amidohydrolase family protein [Hirsutella rhossiliensis]|uniref:Amidohydrolase family domain-containing protein n=1 Tax=Hirsutella rhossiliensis TaxID=111463 RepID=A0A9P8N3J2_9HYPO|nr:amidohydrolase family domain-containing protein [Hirsutella rhossiliensis]KAH0967673.1 amidohydrolase family domain-containing protein [Hirsutella rhossiliensis]